MLKESAMKTYQTAGNVRHVVKAGKMLIIGLEKQQLKFN